MSFFRLNDSKNISIGNKSIFALTNNENSFSEINLKCIEDISSFKYSKLYNKSAYL